MDIFVKYGHHGRELTKELLDIVQLDLDPSMTYAIKPNLVVAKASAHGATTDPDVVAGIVEFLQDHGCRQITIMESSWVGDSTRKAFAVCGYQDLAKRYQVQLVDLKRDTARTAHAQGLELKVCAQALDADFLINVPVLKAHCQTKLTCALKNLKGCIPDSEKRRYHTLGLHQPIAALNTVLRTDLVVVDGLIGDLTFEEGGTPVAMDRVIVGQDAVSVDCYCAGLLGYEPADIPYLTTAADWGVGRLSYNLQELNQGQQTQFSTAHTVTNLRKLFREDQACSACVGSLLHALQRLCEDGVSLQDTPIAIGQGFKGQCGDGLGIGTCTSNYADHVPGCPPSARAIREYLQKKCW